MPVIRKLSIVSLFIIAFITLVCALQLATKRQLPEIMKVLSSNLLKFFRDVCRQI